MKKEDLNTKSESSSETDLVEIGDRQIILYDDDFNTFEFVI